jgi:hypothetical protein
VTTLYRALAEADLELRDDASGDGWTVRGIAVPWGRPTEPRADLGGNAEEFIRGAFADQMNDASRVWLANGHLPMGGKLIGRLTHMRDDAAGLYVEGRISATADGQDARTLVKDGVLDRMSIGFREGQIRRAKGLIQRVTAGLREVALVPNPAYTDAVVLGLRSQECPTCRAAQETLEPTEEYANRAALDQILAQARMDALKMTKPTWR